MALGPGVTVGSYRIVEPLGRGGMASVYKAYEAALDRYVALKVLPAEFLHDETFAERFQREAKVIAKLEHPKIIPIFGFGIDQGLPWMAMRLVAGGTLAGIMKGGRLAPPRVVAILTGVAQALDYAHGKGVVHRDVKPQNVLLDEAERVYLADFGIARMLEGSTALTATGMITGTPQYMSPEQATGQHVDHRTDIYALGIVAYEMLVGRVPFSADTPVAVLLKHVQAPVPLPPPSECAEPLVRALLKCTAKAAEDRYPTASTFIEALEAGAAESASVSLEGASTTFLGDEDTTPTVRSRPATAVAAPAVPAPPRRSAVHVGVTVGAAAFLALSLSVAWRGLRRETGPVAATTSAAPAAAPAPAADAARTADASTRSEAKGPPEALAPARLAIDFEHALKSGTLRIWVDDDLLINTRLESRETKKLIAFKSRKGTVTEVLDVKPGAHSIRVQVTSEDGAKTRTISGTLRSGATRRLEIRLKKDLSLDWS